MFDIADLYLYTSSLYLEFITFTADILIFNILSMVPN